MIILFILLVYVFLAFICIVENSKYKYKDTVIYIAGVILVLTITPIIGSAFNSLIT